MGPWPTSQSDGPRFGEWRVMAEIGGFALVVGIALLAAWGGVGAWGSDSPKPSRN